MFGIGTQIGMTLGIMLAGALAANLGVGYSAFGIAVIVVTVLFVLINRDWSSKEAVVAGVELAEVLRRILDQPPQEPRLRVGVRGAVPAHPRLLRRHRVPAVHPHRLHRHPSSPRRRAPSSPLTLAAFVPTLIAIALSGWWSDKIGRRKVFIYAASAIMVAGLAVPIIMPDMTGMIIMSVINGIGFGLYMSVDAALMTEVLPGGGAGAGKDLGILNIATNIPQAMSPAIAGVIIASFGGYPMLFVFGIVAVIAAALVLIPIKSVR